MWPKQLRVTAHTRLSSPTTCSPIQSYQVRRTRCDIRPTSSMIVVLTARRRGVALARYLVANCRLLRERRPLHAHLPLLFFTVRQSRMVMGCSGATVRSGLRVAQRIPASSPAWRASVVKRGRRGACDCHLVAAACMPWHQCIARHWTGQRTCGRAWGRCGWQSSTGRMVEAWPADVPPPRRCALSCSCGPFACIYSEGALAALEACVSPRQGLHRYPRASSWWVSVDHRCWGSFIESLECGFFEPRMIHIVVPELRRWQPLVLLWLGASWMAQRKYISRHLLTLFLRH